MKNRRLVTSIVLSVFMLCLGSVLAFYSLNHPNIAKLAMVPAHISFTTGVPRGYLSNQDQLKRIHSQTNAIIPKNTLATDTELSSAGVPILMYHHIGDLPANPDPVRKDLTVSTADFANQMDVLVKNGYTSVTTEQVELWLEHKGTLPKKPVVITFDDGYDDVFINAVPVLIAHHMSGAFGIITGFVGTPGYASWAQIQQGKNVGMEIVSHSYSHIDFHDPKYTVQDQLMQIQTSKSDLENNVNVTTSTFIYPYGHYTLNEEHMLAQNGYGIAFTTDYGFANIGENIFEIPRVRVHGQETIDRFDQSLGIKVLPISHLTAQLTNNTID